MKTYILIFIVLLMCGCRHNATPPTDITPTINVKAQAFNNRLHSFIQDSVNLYFEWTRVKSPDNCVRLYSLPTVEIYNGGGRLYDYVIQFYDSQGRIKTMDWLADWKDANYKESKGAYTGIKEFTKQDTTYYILFNSYFCNTSVHHSVEIISFRNDEPIFHTEFFPRDQFVFLNRYELAPDSKPVVCWLEADLHRPNGATIDERRRYDGYQLEGFSYDEFTNSLTWAIYYQTIENGEFTLKRDLHSCTLKIE